MQVNRTFVIVAISGVAIFCCLAFISNKIGYHFWTKNIYTNCQPEEISYGYHESYCLKVDKIYLITGPEYVVTLSVKGDESYGYRVDYPNQDSATDSSVAQDQVIWSISGVELRTSSGIRLLIQSQVFSGTR